jgi:hypothetical protein
MNKKNFNEHFLLEEPLEEEEKTFSSKEKSFVFFLAGINIFPRVSKSLRTINYLPNLIQA